MSRATDSLAPICVVCPPVMPQPGVLPVPRRHPASARRVRRGPRRVALNHIQRPRHAAESPYFGVLTGCTGSATEPGSTTIIFPAAAPRARRVLSRHTRTAGPGGLPRGRGRRRAAPCPPGSRASTTASGPPPGKGQLLPAEPHLRAIVPHRPGTRRTSGAAIADPSTRKLGRARAVRRSHDTTADVQRTPRTRSTAKPGATTAGWSGARAPGQGLKWGPCVLDRVPPRPRKSPRQMMPRSRFPRRGRARDGEPDGSSAPSPSFPRYWLRRGCCPACRWCWPAGSRRCRWC